jgi:hypothetical protein
MNVMMMNVPSSRVILPTKAQICAIADLGALERLRDDVEQSIVKMETDLEFRAGDDSWITRATAALALHRYTERLVCRRISELKAATSKASAGTCRRAGTENDPLTNEVLRTRPNIRPEDINDLPAADTAMEWLRLRIDAVTTDREDEIALPAGERDEAFLAATGSLLRTMRGRRQAVQTKRGEISRSQKLAVQHARDGNRLQLFANAAREILPKETYMLLWDRVDRVEIGTR